MKTLLFLLTSIPLLAQVGVNTTGPTATLDVNGTFRVRNAPDSNSNMFLVRDVDGNVLTSEIESFATRQEMNAPVNFSTISNGYVSTIVSLPLNLSVTVEDGKTADITVTYWVPMGLTVNTNNVDGYMGVRGYRNNALTDGLCGKFKLPLTTDNGFPIAFPMGYVANEYFETVSNSTGSDMVINYSFDGYVEQASTAPNSGVTSYRFGMWAASGQNYNWGVGRSKIEVVIRNL